MIECAAAIAVMMLGLVVIGLFGFVFLCEFGVMKTPEWAKSDYPEF